MASHVIVTGASKGIGKEICRELAARKYNLILVARTRKLLEELAGDLEQKHGIGAVPYAVDLTDLAAIDCMAKDLDSKGIQVTGLVNNAGFGTIGRFEKIDAETETRMIDLNVRALTHLCHLYLPRFKAAGSGFLLNIASMAGLMPMPLMSTYSATKAFVVSFSKSLAVEYEKSGVRICCVCPGVTETEFLDVQGSDASTLPSQLIQAPADVARFAVKTLEKGGSFAVSGAFNQIGAALSNMIPDRTVAKLAYRSLKPATRGRK